MHLDEPVHLVAHDPGWMRIAAQEMARLSRTLEAAADTIQHIGSTAVAGLIAKPIIDLMIGVAAYPPPAMLTERLHELGYECLGEAGVSKRLYFRRRAVDSFNVHLVLLGGNHWLANLSLRELLRSDPAARRRYEAAKLDAIRAGHTMLLAYSNAKSTVTGELIRRAQERAT
ncbi:MAG TPA: GrpB family protein [Steroidobacteraceae bacterium]|jgi:GrpB-like predicted nucleotidyltransferase (UPF0157 family)|nr:GrpB family protein [Steroidobacteraceae bacterium]